MGPIEGWLIVDGNRVLGYVKGCQHPLPYLFVAPRRSGSWYVVRETRCFLGLVTPISKPKPHMLASPFEAATRLRKACREKRSKWCLTVLGFLEELESSIGSGIGVTGSAAYYFEEAGDIDIVVYGSRAGRRAYSVLREMREQGKTTPFKSIGKNWSKKDVELHKRLAEKRLLQGYYKDIPYTIRIVACKKPAPCIPVRVKNIVRVRARIADSSLSYFTPAYYLLEEVHGDVELDRLVMLTHRIRYQELPNNTRIEVLGLIEEHCSMVYALTPDHNGYVNLL